MRQKFSQSNPSLRKFVPVKISFSKNFLLTSWGCQTQCVRAADLVNRQKIVLEPPNSLPLAWQFFADSDRHALIGVLTSYCCFDIEIHAEGHHFHVGNCRGYGQISWPCRENKNRKFFFLVCLLVKFVLAKISHYTVYLWSFILVAAFISNSQGLVPSYSVLNIVEYLVSNSNLYYPI